MSLKRIIDKENVVYLHNGILFSYYGFSASRAESTWFQASKTRTKEHSQKEPKLRDRYWEPLLYKEAGQIPEQVLEGRQ